MIIFLYSSYLWLFFILLAGWVTAFIFIFKENKHKISFFLSFLILALIIWSGINFGPVQNFLVKKVTAVLSKKLQTRVSVKHVDVALFNKLIVEGVLVEDKKKDTLLYAGTAKVNITDWFFFKENATLQYVALQNAQININRTDSVWNYQFLIDYFSSPKKSSGGGGIEFDLQVLQFENVYFNKQDKWIGQDMKVAVNKLDLKADTLNFNRKQIYISELKLDAPFFAQKNYTGLKPKVKDDNLRDLIPKIPVLSALQWNTGGWMISIKNIDVNEATFTNEKETIRPRYADRFDGQHLTFTNITGNLKNVIFLDDTLTTNIKLAAKEQSGFHIKNLESRLKFTPDLMEFKNLTLVTNNSKLGNYFSMRYKNFNDDLSSFIHNVTLEGNFEKSYVSSDDIAYFAPAVKTWNRVFNIEGLVKGPVDNLTAKNMVIKTGNSMVDGYIALRGLPDINTTFIDFKSNNLVTNYTDLTKIIPALKNVTQPDLKKLGNINFKGNYTGFINDFVTYGTISTSLGNVIADINMKLPANKAPTYSGKISSSGFKLGQFLNNNSLGSIALDGNVNGSGFKLNDLKATFKGNVHQIEFSGYNYTNIFIDGSFDKKIFTGHGKVSDPNLKIDQFDGSISFAGKESVFNFEALLAKSDLKKLGVTKDDVALNGRFNLNFTGNTIDNFLGTASVYEASLIHNNNRLSFDSLTLNSYISGNKKFLSFQSNEVEGNVTGKFKILELPDAFKVFLNRYYPAYIPKPKKVVSDQDFSFYLKTKEVNAYVQLIDKKLKGFDNSSFSGNLKLAANELNVNAEIPQFEYDKKVFNVVSLQSKGNLDTLDTKITAGDITINDSLHFPGTILSVKSHNDVSAIELKTSASKTLSQAELNATIKTLRDGVSISFAPSSFIINDKKWQLEKNGELTIRKAFIDASEVKFVQGNQEIVFSTEMDDVTDKTNVIAKLKKVNIDDFTPFFLKKPRLEGMLTGTITLRDPFGKQTVEVDAVAEDFRLDNKDIGTTSLKADVNTATGLIQFKSGTDNKMYKFNVDGSYNYKDTLGNGMDINFLSEHFDMALLDNYLGTVFSNMQGDAAGNLKVSGGGKNTAITGSVTVTDGSLIVKYTQCKYKFSNETIIFNPGEIDFGSLQIKDTLNNTGSVSGRLYHKFFQDFVFDNVNLETGKMLLLNTVKKDNSQFYGKVIGRAVMSLNGPITDMRMKIAGEPSIFDSSHIYLPTGEGREAGVINYIDFIQFGTKMEDISSRKESNLFIDMDLKANPACKIDVILDEATGDIIKGQGNGDLNIQVGTNIPLSIRGRYDITKGDYTFNFQTFLKKPFTLNRGSITWNGDPYLANINIEAEYLAKNVDLSSISSSSGFKQKGDIKIIAALTGILNKPDIKFSFALPEQSPLNGDYFAQNKLEGYRKEPSEMNKQVASLLLINSFISGQQNVLSGSVPFTLAANTIGGVVSGWLTGIFNKSLEKATNGVVSTYLDINSSFDLQSTAALLQANVKTGLKLLLNNRLVILIGGNIDINNPNALFVNKSLITPDITIEYMLTKDGRWRAVVFNRTSIVAIDLTGTQRNKTGAKISYRKDFEKLTRQERIDRRKQRQLKKVLQPN